MRVLVPAAAFALAVSSASCVDTSALAGGADGAGDAMTGDAGDVTTPLVDADVDAGGDAGPRCDPAKPFGAPREVAGLATTNHEGSARLTADEQRVFFHAIRGAATENDLFVASRPDTTSAFTMEAKLGLSADLLSDNHPAISGDGLTLFFGRFENSDWSIYSTTRAGLSAAFDMPLKVGAPIDVAGSELQPYWTGTALYYTTYPSTTGGDVTLHRTTRTMSGWAAPTTLTELASMQAECNPTVTPDELTIYFCSNRPAGDAKGQYDIYMATRASTADAFSNVHNVTEINSTTDEYPDWISPDGCRLYFTSDRVRGDTKGDVFVAERGR